MVISAKRNLAKLESSIWIHVNFIVRAFVKFSREKVFLGFSLIDFSCVEVSREQILMRLPVNIEWDPRGNLKAFASQIGRFFSRG